MRSTFFGVALALILATPAFAGEIGIEHEHGAVHLHSPGALARPIATASFPGEPEIRTEAIQTLGESLAVTWRTVNEGDVIFGLGTGTFSKARKAADVEQSLIDELMNEPSAQRIAESVTQSGSYRAREISFIVDGTDRIDVRILTDGTHVAMGIVHSKSQLHDASVAARASEFLSSIMFSR